MSILEMVTLSPTPRTCINIQTFATCCSILQCRFYLLSLCIIQLFRMKLCTPLTMHSLLLPKRLSVRFIIPKAIQRQLPAHTSKCFLFVLASAAYNKMTTGLHKVVYLYQRAHAPAFECGNVATVVLVQNVSATKAFVS